MPTAPRSIRASTCSTEPSGQALPFGPKFGPGRIRIAVCGDYHIRRGEQAVEFDPGTGDPARVRDAAGRSGLVVGHGQTPGQDAMAAVQEGAHIPGQIVELAGRET